MSRATRAQARFLSSLGRHFRYPSDSIHGARNLKRRTDVYGGLACRYRHRGHQCHASEWQHFSCVRWIHFGWHSVLQQHFCRGFIWPPDALRRCLRRGRRRSSDIFGAGRVEHAVDRPRRCESYLVLCCHPNIRRHTRWACLFIDDDSLICRRCSHTIRCRCCRCCRICAPVYCGWWSEFSLGRRCIGKSNLVHDRLSDIFDFRWVPLCVEHDCVCVFCAHHCECPAEIRRRRYSTLGL